MFYVVPRFTEERVRRLCNEVTLASTQNELDTVAKELRAALEEHIRLARESLHVRATTLPLLVSRKKKTI